MGIAIDAYLASLDVRITKIERAYNEFLEAWPEMRKALNEACDMIEKEVKGNKEILFRLAKEK